MIFKKKHTATGYCVVVGKKIAGAGQRGTVEVVKREAGRGEQVVASRRRRRSMGAGGGARGPGALPSDG